MSCCGKGRQALSVGGRVAMPARSAADVVFEYVGPTSLTVTGPTTGNQYRFGASGVRVRVDIRDRAQLLGIPNLRVAR
jgi:hypothetical protein